MTMRLTLATILAVLALCCPAWADGIMINSYRYATSGGGNTISYASYASQTTASASCVIGKPSGTAEGDLLIVALIDDAAGNPTLPDGWTLIQNIESSSSELTVAYKVAGASEGSDYTFAGSGCEIRGIISRFTKSGGTWDIEASSEAAETTATTTITTASVTATDNSMLFVAFGSDDTSGGSISTAPADMTQIAGVLVETAIVTTYYQARSAGVVTKSITFGDIGNLTAIAVVIDLVE